MELLPEDGEPEPKPGGQPPSRAWLACVREFAPEAERTVVLCSVEVKETNEKNNMHVQHARLRKPLREALNEHVDSECGER